MNPSRSKLLNLLVLALLLGSLLTACGGGFGREKWEYLIVSRGRVLYSYVEEGHSKIGDADIGLLQSADGAAGTLDALGERGWELVSVVGQIGGDQQFVFKRRR